MKLDDIYVMYENNGKYFNSYKNAYFNGKNSYKSTKVNYIFTPTMQSFKRVCELENAARRFFRTYYDCDYFDLIHGVLSKQMNLFGEV